MTYFAASNQRSPGKVLYAVSLMLMLCVASMSESPAQTIVLVGVDKTISYAQTSATDVKVDPKPTGPNYGGPYGFNVHVKGQNLSGLTAPTFTGPVNIAALGAWYNNGKMVYFAGQDAWRSGLTGGWQSPTLADFNSKFGNGTYTITVQGTSVPVQLTGDAYPNAPLMTFSGGAWSNGKYVIDPGKALTITTNPYTAYGSHLSLISIESPFPGVGSVQLSAAIPGVNYPVVPGTNSLTYTVPAANFIGGQDYAIGVTFQAAVDMITNAALPGANFGAVYSAYTAATVSVTKPVFPMVVTGTITPTVANITAAIQYRPQDVGTTGSVYVFALAPVSLVKNVSAAAMINHKGPVARGTSTAAAPLPCVLAQLSASGQLTAVTAGTLQAYLTGVLSSQGQSVSVLNGVSTALIQGSVFYVGYGANSTSMINNGIHRSAVTVPGPEVCQPQAPQTGWWWNPAEDGRGFGIEVSGNNLFMSGYLYDDTGHATWVVSPGPVALDGSFYNGTMYQVANGQTLTGAYKAPSPATTPGTITLSFTDARTGTLIWPGGSIPIQRFDDVIGSQNGVTPTFVPENGWWWNAAEDGRGFFLEFKNNYAFIAGYMYEANGGPVWYLALDTMKSPQNFGSVWLQVAGGQTLTGPYKKATVIPGNVGTVDIQFTDAANATLKLPDGRQVPITRQRF